jgi:hypothetical protein
MKTLIPLVIMAAVGCATHAQQPSAKPVPPPSHAEDVLFLAQTPEPAGLPVPPKPPRAHLEFDAPFKFALGSGSSSRRTLVIPRGEANAETLANAEEDLNVMSVILEKAVEMRSEDEGKKAMGIDIFSSSSGIKNLLIEGHGAIFTLKTRVALLPPPTPNKEEPKEKETTNTEWDEARRALYGPSEIEKEIHRVWGKVQTSFSSSAEEYDEKKLERLKDSLAEALKSASNIRALSGDQTVTVVVLSSSPVGEVRKVVAEAGRGGGRSGSISSSSDRRRVEVYAKAGHEREPSEMRSGARLLLQAKKSDIDAYAKGKLNSEAFRDKVKIQIY